MIALVLGGAVSVWDEAEQAFDLCQPDLVIATNDIGARWAGRLDKWVTLHPEKMTGWREQRATRRLIKASEHIGHAIKDGIDRAVPFQWPNSKASGSSGLFAVKVALEACSKVILAGVPMTPTPHFFNDRPWTDRDGFLDGWRAATPIIKDKVRSFSGWTKHLLGQPTPNWLAS